MRTLAYFVAMIVGTLLLASLLVYPVFQLTLAVNPEWPFHKVASRLWLMLVLAATGLLGRRLALSRTDWGYGVPAPAFRRELLRGFAAGLVSMLPVAAMLIALGTRPLVSVTTARFVHLVVSGLLSGLAVGVIEETLFRGLLQGAVMRDIGRRAGARFAGLLLVSAFYSALHFLARITIPATEVTPASGLHLLSAVANDFVHFGRIADAFLALTAVGLLLSLTRLYTGSIALAIGLHAGWVLVMRVAVGVTARPMDAPTAWLASQSDGFTGWLVFAWTLAIVGTLLALGRVPGLPSRAGSVPAADARPD